MPKIMAALGHFANDGEIKVSIQNRLVEILYVSPPASHLCIEMANQKRQHFFNEDFCVQCCYSSDRDDNNKKMGITSIVY